MIEQYLLSTLVQYVVDSTVEYNTAYSYKTYSYLEEFLIILEEDDMMLLEFNNGTLFFFFVSTVSIVLTCSRLGAIGMSLTVCNALQDRDLLELNFLLLESELRTLNNLASADKIYDGPFARRPDFQRLIFEGCFI